MEAPVIMVGTVLRGFCGGYFGRDSYEDKRVEAVGADWIVARDDFGRVHFACGSDVHRRVLLLQDPENEKEARPAAH
jgi:hypothetical protein